MYLRSPRLTWTHRLFQCHKTYAHPFSPIIPDISTFELELCAYIENRTKLRHQSKSQNHGANSMKVWNSSAWLGSLFAVLASGVRFSELGFQDRQEVSQLYGEIICRNRISFSDQFRSPEFLPMSQNGQLSCSAFPFMYSDFTDSRECSPKRHETRARMDATWNYIKNGTKSRST
jgi:hypothetical protein